jgi:hypothetical protein
MPEVYEPIPGEMVAYGLSLENSDFGNGALSVRAYLLRIWCSNLAITQEEMRQVHLGKRLDDSVLYSRRTYELDAETTVSALRDVIGAQLNADASTRKIYPPATPPGDSRTRSRGLPETLATRSGSSS